MPDAKAKPRHWIILAICLTGGVVCIAAGSWFTWWILRSSPKEAVQLPPSAERKIESSDQLTTFEQNGGVLTKVNKKGRPAPATAPVRVLQQLTDVSLDGLGIEIAPLSNGEKAFKNRDYVWENLPSQFAGWHFTRLTARAPAPIHLTANRAATIYAAVQDERHLLNLTAWELAPELSFTYSDRVHTKLTVYRRALAAGQEITVPEINGAGMFLLIPTDAPAPVQTDIAIAATPAAVPTVSPAPVTIAPAAAPAVDPQPTAAPRIPPQPAPTLPALWLAVGQRPSGSTSFGLIGWEVCRQALLVAARDELGMATRDQSLREWQDDPPADKTLSFTVTPADITLTANGAKQSLWTLPYNTPQAALEPQRLAETTEKWSRDQLPAALRRAGYTGTPETKNTNAPVPPEAEKLLDQFDELSQFGALRLVHAAIRDSGQSPQRLGALVRGYANLGQLTKYHVSAESAVYAARALLYAQRMVALYPRTASPLRHRAYAKAMAGLPAAALADLKNAAKQGGAATPEKWVALLDPFCHYQTKTLTTLADADPTQAPLALFMAFLTVEHTDCQALILNVTQPAFDASPHCIRLLEAMCQHTGPGMLNELVPREQQIISDLLGSELTTLPGMPKSVVDLVNQSRRPEGNPSAREQVCQRLLIEGSSTADSGEPSFAALGRLIQETTFAQVQRQANLLGDQWGVDASDYVKQSLPLVADHPYRCIIEAYGIEHDQTIAVVPAVAKLIAKAPLEQITYNAYSLWGFENMAASSDPDGSNRVYQAMYRNADLNAPDIERILLWWGIGPKAPPQLDLEQWLNRVAPDSPVLMAVQIRDSWSDASAAKWEAAAVDHPTVATALASRFENLKQWEDAERWMKAYVAISPDSGGYRYLAQLFHEQGNDDLYLATMKEALKLPDYDLGRANIQTEIANFYMDKQDFASAVTWADQAAATGAGWALITDADAHAGAGDWAGAEQLVREEVDHYSEPPFKWYKWCVRTGHGDRAGAAAAARAWFKERDDHLTEDDLLSLSILNMLEGDDDSAIKNFQRRLEMYPNPFTSLHIALLAGGKKRPDLRDAMLTMTTAYPGASALLTDFTKLFKAAAAEGSAPDAAKMNDLLAKADPLDRMTICYLTGRYLEDIGRKNEAVAYWQRGVTGIGPRDAYNADMELLEDALRKHGIDPVKLELTKPTTRPG